MDFWKERLRFRCVLQLKKLFQPSMKNGNLTITINKLVEESNRFLVTDRISILKLKLIDYRL